MSKSNTENGNRFLANAISGSRSIYLQVLAILITWIFWALIGSAPVAILVAYVGVIDPASASRYMNDPMNMDLLGLAKVVVFVAIMGQFLIGFLGIWLSETKILGKRFLAVLNGYSNFRWSRAFKSFFIWMGFMLVYQIITYLIDPNSLQFHVDWKEWLVFFPIGLLLVPLQSAFEEVAIRGQLLQAFSRITPALSIFPLLATSLVFALLHLANTEVSAYGTGFMMLHYFSFAFILGAISMMDEGLELAIGIHASNNIFSLSLVSYPNASLDTPTIFQQQEMAAEIDYLVMLGFVAVFLIVFFGRKIHAFKAVIFNYSPSNKRFWVNPAELAIEEKPTDFNPWE